MLTFACASGFALSGSGDSAPGNLDTVAPTPGTATVPPTGVIAGEAIPYAGASDASGIARVELWARENSASWAFTTQFSATASGSFTYVPAGTGVYHFELVAEDTLGNRSAAPSGTTGTGQGSATFTTNRLVGSRGIAETGTAVSADVHTALGPTQSAVSLRRLIGYLSHHRVEEVSHSRTTEEANGPARYGLYVPVFDWQAFSLFNVGRLRSVLIRSRAASTAVGALTHLLGLHVQSPLMKESPDFHQVHGMILNQQSSKRLQRNLKAVAAYYPARDPGEASAYDYNEFDTKKSGLMVKGSNVLGNGVASRENTGYGTDVVHVDGFVRLTWIDPAWLPSPPVGSLYLSKTAEDEFAFYLNDGSSLRKQSLEYPPGLSAADVYLAGFVTTKLGAKSPDFSGSTNKLGSGEVLAHGRGRWGEAVSSSKVERSS